MKITLAKTAGFCFGVDRAVRMTYDLVAEGKRVATLGQLIHNPQVVDDLHKKGVRTISEPEEASVEKSGITYWLDFGNGTALSLYGNDCASIYSYSGEALDPSKTDGLTWRLNGRFLDLDNYVIRAIISSR